MVVNKSFVLSIDIGNTAATFGVLKAEKVKATDHFKIGLSHLETKRQIKRILNKFKRAKYSFSNIIICSVVPKKTKLIAETIKNVCGMSPEIIGQTIKVPIKNNYRVATQVGQDRLVGAYAVKHLYGFPAIIIDFGTAITFDVLNAKGEYDGGVIVPGIRLTTESLFSKTALLPNIDTIKPPRGLVGKDTKDSILSGIFNGYGAMCQGLIDSISLDMKNKPKVIVTGGYTKMMKKYISSRIEVIDRDLVLKGLALLVNNDIK